MTPDRTCFEFFSSVRGNLGLADKTQVEYTGVGSVRLSSRLPSGDIAVVLLLAKLIGEMGIYSREERRIVTNKRKQGGKWRTQVCR
jgi:hypothetical protein